MPIPTSWNLCGGQGPGGPHTCCVHVGPVKDGPEGRFRAVGCCWCNNNLPFPMSPMPPLPDSTSRARHGPLMRGHPVARPRDLTL